MSPSTHWLAGSTSTAGWPRVAAAPLLLDAYQVQIEQNIMAETTFDVLLVASLWLLLGWGVPGWKRAARSRSALGRGLRGPHHRPDPLIAVMLYLVVVGNAWRRRRLRAGTDVLLQP